MKIGVCRVERSHLLGQDTLSVVVKKGGFERQIDDVPHNIVRCALGEADLAYLLGEQTADDYVEGESEPEDEFVRPAFDESGCFSITESEYKDFVEYGYLVDDGYEDEETED